MKDAYWKAKKARAERLAKLKAAEPDAGWVTGLLNLGLHKHALGSETLGTGYRKCVLCKQWVLDDE